MIFNRFLAIVIIVCTAFLVIGLLFYKVPYVHENIDPWSMFLLFLMPLFLLTAISRFKKLGDTGGKRLGYIGIYSFIAAVALPLVLMFTFWNSSFSLDGTLSYIVLGFLPAVGIIMTMRVAIRLLSDKKEMYVEKENPYLSSNVGR